MSHIKGRKFITQVHLEDEPYRFDVIGLWRDTEGGFYLGTDSGCSCPMPWESHTEDSLTGPLTLDQVVEEAISLWRTSGRKVPVENIIRFLTAGLRTMLVEANLPYTFENPQNPRLQDYTGYVQDANGLVWHKYEVELERAGQVIGVMDAHFPLTAVEQHD